MSSACLYGSPICEDHQHIGRNSIDSNTSQTLSAMELCKPWGERPTRSDVIPGVNAHSVTRIEGAATTQPCRPSREIWRSMGVLCITTENRKLQKSTRRKHDMLITIGRQ